MITINEQQGLFTDIARALTRKITVYAIGGTAMIFLGLKGATLDIDLVFMNEEDRRTFKQAVKSLGYPESDARVIYGKRENVPEMINVAEGRIDLFLLKIITSTFSDEMQKRAVQSHEFDRNLIIKAADFHDVIIMKSATAREKDEADIVSIIRNSKIDWNVIIEEAKNQVKLGNLKTILTLGETLERINNKKLIEVPISVLDTLWDLLKNQVRDNRKKRDKISL